MQLSRKNVLVRRSSVCPYVLSVPWSLSRKLRKMDPLLPQNIISKLSPPILLPIHILHRHPPLGRYPGFNFFKCWHINMESCSTCRQTTAIVNRVRPSSHLRCSQLLKTECDRRNLLSTIIVACTCGMTPKSNNRQASFFSQWKRYSRASKF